MGYSITTQLHYGDLVEPLIDDPEETVFLLEGLAERADDAFFEDVEGLIAGTTAEKVEAFARRLADTIKNRP